MIALPITKNDAKFFCNGQEIGTMSDYKFSNRAIYDNNYVKSTQGYVFADYLKQNEFKLTGKIYTIEKWKKYKKYINRCNRWRNKKRMRLLTI